MSEKVTVFDFTKGEVRQEGPQTSARGTPPRAPGVLPICCCGTPTKMEQDPGGEVGPYRLATNWHCPACGREASLVEEHRGA